MPAFLIKLSGFLGVQLALFAGLMLRHPGDADHFFAATIDKHHLADTAPGPRLIIVGGSNGIFAYDSPRLHEATGYHPVNMALNMPLGSEFMLREAADVARRGDVVLLSLEFEHFLDGPMARSVSELAAVVTARPANVRYLTWAQGQRLLDHGLGILQDHLRRAWKRGATRQTHVVRSGFNSYGDLVAHESLARRYKLPPVRPPMPPQLERLLIEEFVDRLNRFVDDCAERGVTVLLVYPTIDQQIHDRYAEGLASLDAVVRRRFHGHVLNTPATSTQPAQMFFDAFYHPTRAGKLVHTERVLQALRPFVK